MPITKTISSVIRRYFISGVLVVVPLIITYLVLKFFFDTIDNILRPVLVKLTGHDIPGLGLVTTIALIFAVGVLTRNFVGKRLIRLWNNILERVPFVRPVYSSARQLLEATTTTTGSFKEVVIVEYPRRGAWTISFVAQFLELDIDGEMRKFVSVFVPSAPTPLTGWTVLVPLEDVVSIDMTIEQALSYCVSGGALVPPQIRREGKLEWKKPGEVAHEAG